MTKAWTSSTFTKNQVRSMEADKISALPGQPDGVDFNQHAGYVAVDQNAGKELFYYFVESPINSQGKPLVLWLNGGPGCSSLGTGAFEELGPFRVNSDGETLYKNPYAWNNVANVIFLESPAGVGFSYGKTPAIYNDTGDKSTAKDAYAFLVNWLKRFPQYKSRPFFISGESYAGHYVPQLASHILQKNNHNKDGTIINLKGIIVGNGVLNYPTDNQGTYDHLWTHALISDETHEQILKYCDFYSENPSIECINFEDETDVEVGNIDYYDIYAPLCLKPAPNGSIGSVDNYDPCSDNYVTAYLNLERVQEALHAKPTNWSVCNNYNWTDSAYTVLPDIKKLMANNVRVWIYSGDVDAVVPVTATRYSLDSLKLPINTTWYPWYLNSQVGGYVVGYEGLTFVTVRGAGHEVPSYQPERALALISSFLQGTLPPSS
ncbi:hypothetical protein Nepgr_009198 [Nepenthes gracilis]|uniref:Carboxypeptidase n=1 Tax=Nepenthes gracilis TaxID=150966 RepID=A0AAD3SA71_NEPGR|nr:hypothetical protein Nepgr_009198 [Nepenthes gracilis]